MKSQGFYLAIPLFVISGCGGATIGVATNFKGVYKAPYTSSTAVSGTAEFVIDGANDASVKITNGADSFVGTGHVASDNSLAVDASNGTSVVHVNTVFKMTGGVNSASTNISVDGAGAWTASTNAVFLADTQGHLYQGFYLGMISGPVSGNLNLTVSPDGTIEATVVGDTFTYTGSGTITGVGTVDLSLGGTGTASASTIKFKGDVNLLGTVLTNSRSIEGTYSFLRGGVGTGSFSASSGVL